MSIDQELRFLQRQAVSNNDATSWAAYAVALERYRGVNYSNPINETPIPKLDALAKLAVGRQIKSMQWFDEYRDVKNKIKGRLEFFGLKKSLGFDGIEFQKDGERYKLSLGSSTNYVTKTETDKIQELKAAGHELTDGFHTHEKFGCTSCLRYETEHLNLERFTHRSGPYSYDGWSPVYFNEQLEIYKFLLEETSES